MDLSPYLPPLQDHGPAPSLPSLLRVAGMSEKGAEGVKGAIGPRPMCAGPTYCVWPVVQGSRFCFPHGGGRRGNEAEDNDLLPCLKEGCTALVPLSYPYCSQHGPQTP